jgi:hypothetical protein
MHCGDEQKYGTIATIDQPGACVIVNPGGTNERFDRAHLQKATIVPWSDNTTIFDAHGCRHTDTRSDLIGCDFARRMRAMKVEKLCREPWRISIRIDSRHAARNHQESDGP